MTLNINELNSNQVEVAEDVLKTSKILNKLSVLMFLLFFPTICAPLGLAIVLLVSPEGEMNMNFWNIMILIVFGIIGGLLAWGEQSLINKFQLKLAKSLIEREMKLGSFLTFSASCSERGGNFIPFISDSERIYYETEKKEYVFTFKPCKYSSDIFVEAKISKELFDKYEKEFLRGYLRTELMDEPVSFIDSNSELFANGLEVNLVSKD